MNLVTQTLIERIGNHPITNLVRWWDLFEAAVIQVYKTRTVSEDDRKTLVAARREIMRVYARWQETLKPYWLDLRIEGEPVSSDPFRTLLAVEPPESFVENWTAMQTLPVAREAINRFLLDQIAKPE